MASGSGGGGRGRHRRQTEAVSGGGAVGGGVSATRECESCRAAPGIPFCRVEWSFLCTGCAAVVHGHSWIVAVPPNPAPGSSPNPNPNPSPYPYPYPGGLPCQMPQNPNPGPNPGGEHNHVVQLSSDEEEYLSVGGDTDGEGSNGTKRRRRAAAEEEIAGGGREASMMRYKEKRKSRRFDKTVRYEARKVYADLRPRIDGKFARPPEAGEDAAATAAVGDEALPGVGAEMGSGEDNGDGNEQLRSDASEEVRMNFNN